MYSHGQPTSPVNSPSQQAITSTNLLHTPEYLLPARSDSEASRYYVQGLRLYGLPHTLSGASVSQHSTIVFPPLPHPTETWASMSNSASPMIQEPVIHSRKSRGWASDEDAPPLSTVAPGKLLNGNLYPCEYPQPSPMTPKYEHTPEHEGDNLGPIPQQGQPKVDETMLVQKRRAKSASKDAKGSMCGIRGKSFVRKYNMELHEKLHYPDRAHKCNHCTREFARKAELDRHIKSVHDKKKDLPCIECGEKFSRKDTLRRHQGNGCKKYQLIASQVQLARSIRAAPNAQQAYYHSPRLDLYPVIPSGAAGYHHPQAVGYDARSPALFDNNTFRGHIDY